MLCPQWRLHGSGAINESLHGSGAVDCASAMKCVVAAASRGRVARTMAWRRPSSTASLNGSQPYKLAIERKQPTPTLTPSGWRWSLGAILYGGNDYGGASACFQPSRRLPLPATTGSSVRLIGKESNPDAIGARISWQAGDLKRSRLKIGGE